MIKAENVGYGISVKMSGSTTDLLEELTAIIKGIRANFIETFGEELSGVLIAQSGKLAFAECDDDRDAIIDETIKILESSDNVQVIR